MSYKQICTSLLVTIACCIALSAATPLSYLSDNIQNGSPFGNQNQGFTYLRDDGVNQPIVYPQSGPVNYINNIGGSQVQTIGAYPGVVSNVGLVGSNVYGSNIVSNVNGLNGLSTIQSPLVAQSLPVNQIVSYPSIPSIVGGSQIQTISSYPNTINNVGLVGNNGFGSNIINNVNSVNSLPAVQYQTVAQPLPVNQLVSYPSVQPVAQYAVQQPSVIGGIPNNNNQITNNQVAPVEVNISGNPSNYGCYGAR